MRLLAHLRLSLWLCALGTVVLYVFFIALARVPPRDIAAVTLSVAVLAVALLLRGMRLDAELTHPGGDPALRRALNRQRERRGF
jgi:hypothetical protein